MIIDSIIQRRSGMVFSPKAIEPNKLEVIFQSATLAASSMNIQPWRYIYANYDDFEFQLILNTLSEGNQRWAKNASVLVLSIAQVEYVYKEKVIKNEYAWHDTGMANAHLMLQATSMELATHIMGGFDHKKIAANFNLPSNYQPVAVIAIGYKGDETKITRGFT